MEERKLICQNDLIDMNKKYKPTELKIFYNLLYFYKEQEKYKQHLVDDEEIVCISIEKLENYIGGKHLTDNELSNLIINIPKGIFSKDKMCYVAVFNFIKYDSYNKEIIFGIIEEFKPFLNDVVERFTVLELKELSKLNSSYSQRLFEFASKNKNIGRYLFPISEFRMYFNVPDSYSMCNIDQRVINSMIKEVNEKTNFNIQINKIKRKNKVTHIEFIF